MKYWAYAVLLTSGLLAASPASAANDVLLRDPDNLDNLATLNISGDLNVLMIEQTLTGGSDANSVTVSVSGNRNGGPQGSSFTGTPAQSGLTPGALIQSGFGNVMTVSVTGDDNLFAFSQVGNRNNIQATMIGYSNQAAVSQVGNGNFASFTQNGVGNMVNIRQISR